MIVACPQCETKFEIPDDKYRPGRKARCSNCGNVFPLPELAASSTGDAGVPSLEDDLFASLDADVKNALPEEAPAPFSDKDGSEKDGSENNGEDSAFKDFAPEPEEDDVPPPPASVEDAVLDSNEEKPAKRGRKKLFIILAAVLVLLLLGGGGFLLYSVFFSPVEPTAAAQKVDSRTSLALDGKSGADAKEGDASRQSAVRRLALEKVRQYTVADNQKAGRMMVIEGNVVNNLDTLKDLILLEVTLYDEKGNPRVLREQYCGVTLSLMQLTTMPKAALENVLNNQTDIFTNNMNIPPGGRVPS
jgi:predicted Zn finger-like uncharacterized protein